MRSTELDENETHERGYSRKKNLLCYDLYVYDNIKLYNVRERRVHLTEASPIGCVQNVTLFCERFEVIMYIQPGVSVL